MDSPWEEDPHYAQEAAWHKLSTEFTSSGYREGIIAGKETSLQEGFDAGFANVGVPIGREMGNLRGIVAALVSLLTSQSQGLGDACDFLPAELEEARAISASLSQIRFTDVAPPDVEAEQHARDHLESDDNPGLAQTEELEQKQNMESLEDMLSQLSTGPSESLQRTRPTIEDVARLRERLSLLSERLGLDLLR